MVGPFPDEFAGTLYRVIPRPLVNSSTLACFTTGGQVAVRSLELPVGLVVSNISLWTGTTAASGPTHSWAGILDASLRVLAVSADQLTAAIAANSLITFALTSPLAIQVPGLYYCAVSSTATTTAPTLAGGSLATGLSAPAPVMCGSAGTQSLPPAVGAQLAGGTIANSNAMNYGVWLS